MQDTCKRSYYLRRRHEATHRETSSRSVRTLDKSLASMSRCPYRPQTKFGYQTIYHGVSKGTFQECSLSFERLAICLLQSVFWMSEVTVRFWYWFPPSRIHCTRWYAVREDIDLPDHHNLRKREVYRQATLCQATTRDASQRARHRLNQDGKIDLVDTWAKVSDMAN